MQQPQVHQWHVGVTHLGCQLCRRCVPRRLLRLAVPPLLVGELLESVLVVLGLEAAPSTEFGFA